MKASLHDSLFKRNIVEEQIILSVSAMLTLLILGWVLWYCRYGIGFSDEGFYLIWIDNPFKYSNSVYLFGFIYHPLYLLLEGNIAELRQINILITFGLSWLLSHIFLKNIFGNQNFQNIYHYVISAGISTSTLLILRGWNPNPNYNWLNLQAIMLVCVGLLLAEKNLVWRSILGYLLIGVGAWLVFMAKPTTFALLYVVSFLYLLSSKKINASLFLLTVLSSLSLLIISALTIDGSIIGFIDRLKIGAENAKMLNAGHNLIEIFRFGFFSFGKRGSLIFIAFTALFYTIAYSSQSHTKRVRYAGTIINALIVMTILALVIGLTHKTINDLSGWGEGFVINSRVLYIWSVPIAVFLYGYSKYQFDGLRQIPRHKWILALTFAVIPYAYAFGSNLNYWWVGAAASIFWVLSGFIFLSPLAGNRHLITLLMTFCLAVQLIVVVVIHAGIEWPFGHAAQLYKGNNKVGVGKHGSILLLPANTADYIAEAKAILIQNGFRIGTSIIDLTGRSPGLVFTVGGESPGDPYIIGGFPGSIELAIKTLKASSCDELAGAWILYQPRTVTALSATEILPSFGANLVADYRPVGLLKEPSVGKSNDLKNVEDPYTQYILKPARSLNAAIDSCYRSRMVK